MPQQTGFVPQMQQPQRTGYMPQQQQPQFQQQPSYSSLRPMPLQGQPTGFQRPMQTGFVPQQSFQSQQQRTPTPLLSQPTGYPGMASGPMPGQIGLGSQFLSSFLPAQNITPNAYMDPNQMQFASSQFAPPPPQQQQQQQVPIPWALEKDEKKRYDQIFRAWDQSGSGFIMGNVAKEVFGQAGLERDDLMSIWNLADVNDRGKLNIDEFHVAMGLIYRRLNGNPIPSTLPPEMAPPSARDLGDSVDFVSRLLKNDTHARSTNSSPDGQQSYAKLRSFGERNGGGNRKDATVYRFDEEEVGGYKSKSRHLDRKDVRVGGEEGLDEVRKQLDRTKSVLEESYKDDEEEDEMKDRLRDLKRRIGRVQDDLEYVNQGRKTSAKEDERRKLERELLRLEHEELPGLVRKMEEAERRKRVERKKFDLERDDRNKGRRARYERSRERRRSPSPERERERGYRRGTYDRSSDDDDDDGYRSSRSKPTSRPRSPPPPPPVPVPAPKAAPTPPPVAAPAMTPVERQAFIKAEAQRRIQDRLRALGVSSAPTPDTSVQDRLEAERVEALKKAEEMDKVNKGKEEARLAKLERERARGVEVEKSIKEMEKDEEAVKVVRGELEKTGEGVAKQAAEEQLDVEEKAILEKEKALEREREERREKLRRLEKEVEEARRAEEDFVKNKDKFAKAAPKPPPARTRAPPAPPATKKVQPPVEDDDFDAPSPPPPPPAPPAAPPVKSPGGGSTNPFLRMGAGATPSPTPPTTTATSAPKANPFFPPPPSVAPPVAVAPVKKKVIVDDDDWDSPAGLEKNNESDSSDDEDFGDRNKRANIAQALFGGGNNTSRPSSAQANTPPRSTSTPAPPAPPAAPPAPRAPTAPTNNVPAAPIAPPSALLGQIQGGLKLKKTQTKDKSGPAVSGSVIGDPSPPVQHYVPPPVVDEPEPEPEPEPVQALPVAREEEEEEQETLPAIVSHEEADPMGDFDTTTTIRMRSLYTYEGQRPEDLGFEENIVILAHPPKDSASPWWHGKISSTGRSGLMPNSYVEEIQAQSAKALFDYTGANSDELSFAEADTLSIVDSSDPNWWKAEKDGVIGVVPATYCELNPGKPTTASSEPVALSIAIPPAPASLTVQPPSADHNGDAHSEAIITSDEEDTSDDDDSDADSPDARSPTERETERLRVLEAAGIISRNDAPSPRGAPRRRAPRRPAPSRPARTAPALPKEDGEQLENAPPAPTPPLDEHEDDHEERMEDAYDLYQRYMRELPPLPNTTNRTSVHEGLGSPRTSQFSPPASPAPSVDAATKAEHRQSVTGSFLSRVVAGVSRTSTSATGDRPRPVVSSPMMSAPSSDNLQVSPSIGASWASLIDPGALANVPDRERKRQESIFEFIMTEQTYVQSLQLIIEVFYAKLQTLLTQKASQIIFANIEDIMMFNTIFLSELEDRQRESRLYVDTIGDVIKSHMKSLDVYRGYCVNQSNAAATLADLKSSDPNLRGALETLRVKNLELEHFLLEPMQRLTRYPLLINQIMKYTEPDHPDQVALEAAHATASTILSAVNESVRARENEEKLAMLTHNLEFAGVDARLELAAPTRYQGPRKILREGNVTKAKSGRVLKVYLFNDLLLFTETKAGGTEIVYRWPIPLDECSVRDSKKDDAGFQIAHRGESINVRAGTARQCLVWMKDIKEARQACLSALEKRRKA